MLIKHGLAGTTFKDSGGGSGLITTNLEIQFEMDNTTAPTSTNWVDEIAGMTVTKTADMAEPAIISAGTPTGEDYYEFTANEGLGNTDITSFTGIPSGAESRTMFLVARYATPTDTGAFQGVLYGNPATNEAFGITLDSGDNHIIGDFWASEVQSGTNYNDATWHVFCCTYDGTNARIYGDNTLLGGPTAKTLNTSATGRFYFNEKLNNVGSSRAVDVAACLIYSSVLSTDDRTQVHDYLDSKYITV